MFESLPEIPPVPKPEVPPPVEQVTEEQVIAALDTFGIENERAKKALRAYEEALVVENFNPDTMLSNDGVRADALRAIALATLYSKTAAYKAEAEYVLRDALELVSQNDANADLANQILDLLGE